MPHSQDGVAQRAYGAPDRSSPTHSLALPQERHIIRAVDSRREGAGPATPARPRPHCAREAGASEAAPPLSQRTSRSRLVGSARLLHPSGVAEVGRGQDRVVAATGDRSWCSANREAAASAEATSCLPCLVRRGAQQRAPAAALDDRRNRQRPRHRAAASAHNRAPTLRRDSGEMQRWRRGSGRGCSPFSPPGSAGESSESGVTG
jgi:hypothetical protein